MIEKLLFATLGFVTYPTLYKTIRYSLPASVVSDYSKNEISGRSVSAIQALTAVLVGVITMMNTGDDIVYSRFIPLDYYVCFWIPYFYYDTWADYKVYVSKRANEMADKDFLSRVKLFVKYQPLMVLHHFFLPMVYGPALLHFRHGKGDYIIGCAITMQATIPFISLRHILLQVEMRHTTLYIVNGLLLAVSFSIARIYIWFHLVHTYAVYRGLPFISGFLALPTICSCCTIGFFILNSIWFVKILLLVKRSSKEILNLLKWSKSS
ncbi:hypothetical protein EB796_005334 [Bugula neritina]|uniref:TLC domain-containing protein n=1 Tax=Bugula neritina TaxID=10212 RepID=A0A7J7KDK6_BUGNE|nr:hypothetical protein EB796_005334 [Bugula neritina]